MKKRYSAILGVVIVLAGMFTAQSASAASGGWQPYPGGFTTPSNWTCGSTVNGPKVSAQACVVRSGYYVQAVTIVRNRTSASVTAAVDQGLYNTLNNEKTYGTCSASGLAPNSVSVCFTPTVWSSLNVTNAAVVREATSAAMFPGSPYA